MEQKGEKRGCIWIADINKQVYLSLCVKKIIDYTLMTDFFLTYRTFISPAQLCKLLILRFRWGLESDQEERCIVRIR